MNGKSGSFSKQKRYPVRMRRLQRGFSLMETVAATALTGILVTTSLSTFSFVSKNLNRSGSAHKATEIAQLLLVEISEKPFEEVGTASSTIGVETGESLSNRASLDDVDDYNGLTLSTITDRSGTAVAGTTGWRATVTVLHIAPATLASAGQTRTGLKRVDVTLTDSSGKQYKNSVLRSVTGTLQAQAFSSTDPLQTSVDIAASVGGQNWVSTARFNNQQVVKGSGTTP